MSRTIIILTCILSIAVLSDAAAAVKWLYNDSLVDPLSSNTVPGSLVPNDVMLARFFPDFADYPLQVRTIQILVRGSASAQYTAMFYDGTGTHPQPGTEIYSQSFIADPDVFYNVDVSAGGVYIYSGEFVAGYRIDDPFFSQPATDTDSCVPGNNIMYFDAVGDYLEGCNMLFLRNDLVIRCEVETNVPTPTPRPTITPTPLPIPVTQTGKIQLMITLAVAVLLFLFLIPFRKVFR